MTISATLTPLPYSHPEADPFGETVAATASMQCQILGGRFFFQSNSRMLLKLAEAAYEGLPEHRFSDISPEFHIELRLVAAEARSADAEPPPVRLQSGAGLLCGVVDASNYIVISPQRRRALIVVSADRLAHAYYVRYELIEFAVFVLATRGLGLVPLHGACIGREGRGVLLLGASSAGKSTLALHALLAGMELLGEDSVFAHPGLLLATAVSNYLHVRAEALKFVEDAAARRWISEAPVIRRRSGVEKFEPDLRRLDGARLARAPLRLVAAVAVSADAAIDGGSLLRALPADIFLQRIGADQRYAASQPGWSAFAAGLAGKTYALQRARHPRDSIDAIARLLE